MVQYRHNAPYYELHFSELEEDVVRVLAFEGIENISRLFKYSFQLLSENPELKPEEILNKKATFTMNRGDEDPLQINGIISRFEQRGQSPDYVSYFAELVPKMWRLGLTFQSRIFHNMDIEKIVTEVLETSEFSGDDFEFKLNETYPDLEFAVQYRESDFDFVNRRLEHFGICYYFDFREGNDVIVFTDANDNLPKIDLGEDVFYNPNKDPLSETETVNQFIYQGQVVTGKTQLKDYNYRNPSKDLLSESQISEDNPGTYSDYGDHYKDESEGEFLARVRNEEIICNSVIYKGKSDCRLFRAGYKFTIGKHYREDWNTDYLLTHVLTRGNQQGLFGILPPTGKIEPTYENYFEALPPDIIFRPKRLTQHPKIHGILNARIDAAGDGEQAEIDDQGRYKVILPFDLSGKSDGEASHYIRMIQPYAGPNFGIHFPLHKNTEVLLSFVDGNPDRPVIAGAVPNPVTSSPVTAANADKSIIRDHYGNEIVFDATPGEEKLRLHSPNNVTGIELGGTTNNYYTKSDKYDATLGNKLDFCFGSKGDIFIGNALDFRAGLIYNLLGGLEFNMALAGRYTQNWSYDVKNNSGPIISTTKKDILTSSKKDNVIAAGDQVCIVGGSTKVPPEGAQPSDTQRSIIGVYPEKLSFSVGAKSDTHEIRTNRALKEQAISPNQDLYENTPKTWYNVGVIAPSMLASVLTMGWGIAADFDEEGAAYGASWGSIGIASAIGAGVMAILTYCKEMTDAKIEPIVHKNPAARLELEHDGKINVHSKENEISLEVGNVEGRAGQAREANSLSKISMSKIPNQLAGRMDFRTRIDGGDQHKESKISLNVGDAPNSQLKIHRSQYPAGDSHIIMDRDQLKIFSQKSLRIENQEPNSIIKIDSGAGDIILKTIQGRKVYFRGGDIYHRNFSAAP
jgi:type VI secretion system secreted protein VgrG